MINLAAYSLPALPVIGIFIIYYASNLALSYIKRKKIAIPSLAQEVLQVLGGNVILDAYYKAEKEATEPDAKRDIATAFILASAKKAGISVSTSTINFLIEFIVNVVKNSGPVSAANLAKLFPGK